MAGRRAREPMDTNKASITRVHDAMLGGKDNYTADRAVRYLVGHAGVSQFLDCGACLPTTENTHDVALRINPESSIIYASKDPLVLTYARALLADNDHTHVAEVNITRAEHVLADPIIRKHQDFDQPVALLHVLTLHHVPDKHDPWDTMRQYVDAMAPGSY